MFAAFHRTRHRQIPDGAAVYIAEQADIMRAAVDGQIFDGMALAVKCAGVGRRPRIKGITNADWRPCFAAQINVFRQFGADFGVFYIICCIFCIIHLIPEPFQPLGGANLIGVCLRAAAGGKRGGAGDRTVECATGDGAVIGDCTGKNAAGDGAVVDDLAVEYAAFDGAAGGNGHFAIEHSLAGACNGTGTLCCISQHDVAVNRAAVGEKFPIARCRRAGDV